MNEPTQSAGWRQIEHTADMALKLWAADEESLLEVAAGAIVEILTDGYDPRPNSERLWEVSSIDAEDRLIQWMNEVLVAAVIEGFLFARAEINLQPSGLKARVWGESQAGHRIVTELKSATYHDLKLCVTQASAQAQVVIDV